VVATTAAGIKERRLREVRNAERLGRECRAARSSRRDGAGWGNGRRSLIARKVAEESRNAGARFGELVSEQSDLAVQVVDFCDLLRDLFAEHVGLGLGDESLSSGSDSLLRLFLGFLLEDEEPTMLMD
jgi:hypothetical protein